MNANTNHGWQITRQKNGQLVQRENGEQGGLRNSCHIGTTNLRTTAVVIDPTFPDANSNLFWFYDWTSWMQLRAGKAK